MSLGLFERGGQLFADEQRNRAMEKVAALLLGGAAVDQGGDQANRHVASSTSEVERINPSFEQAVSRHQNARQLRAARGLRRGRTSKEVTTSTVNTGGKQAAPASSAHCGAGTR